MAERVICPSCGYSMSAGEVADGIVSDDDGVLQASPYADPRVDDDPYGQDHQGLGAWGPGPHAATLSGIGQGVQSSSGREGTDPASRKAFLYGKTDDPIVQADRDLAGAEEDWSKSADELRVLRYELTHTDAEEPQERSLNAEGIMQLAEAERAEYRLHREYETARDRRNALLDEWERSSQPLPPGLRGCLWDYGGDAPAPRAGSTGKPTSRGRSSGDHAAGPPAGLRR
jgi:hypothetical protein